MEIDKAKVTRLRALATAIQLSANNIEQGFEAGDLDEVMGCAADLQADAMDAQAVAKQLWDEAAVLNPTPNDEKGERDGVQE